VDLFGCNYSLVNVIAIEISCFERAFNAHWGVVETDFSLADIKVWVSFDFLLDTSNTSFCFKVFFTFSGVVGVATKFA
jgi:hypothetical protein